LENTMRTISKLVFLAALIAATPAAFAQAGDDAKIAVEQPWARATPAGAMTGAAYMTLANKTNTADRLTGVSSDVAAKVQIHQMKVVNGVMQMRDLDSGLAIPANGSVALKPGSYHVMLMGLKKPLVAGQSFPLTLTFAKAGTISVTVPVQAMGATSGNGGMSGMSGTGGMQRQDKGGGMGKMEMK
jgi:periplasmic copper chaperone A